MHKRYCDDEITGKYLIDTLHKYKGVKELCFQLFIDGVVPLNGVNHSLSKQTRPKPKHYLKLLSKHVLKVHSISIMKCCEIL